MRANHLFVIITVALLSTMQLAAQSVTPFVQEGKQWNFKSTPSMPQLGGWEGTIFNKMEGDTVIDGYTYKKVWSWTNQPNSVKTLSHSFYREEGSKLYQLDRYGEETLVYDTNLEVGDSLQCGSSEYIKVLYVGDTALFYDQNNDLFTSHYCKLGFGDDTQNIFYEGIGIIEQMYVDDMCICDWLVGGFVDLLCISINDETICDTDMGPCEFPYNWITAVGEEADANEIKCYPNPFSNSLKVELPSKKASVQIIDIAGRVLYSAFHEGASATINTEVLPKGMYILRVTNEGQSYNQKIIKH